MAAIAITMFMGITLLAHAFQVCPPRRKPSSPRSRAAVFGGRGIAYYVVQAATMLILVLAANTAYADFPRLASIVARDRFLPRQFMSQGDRLAFSNGILILSVLAAGLLVVFGGDTHALIPLYMIGVFISFTLSQAGMVLHWRRERSRAGGRARPSTPSARSHRRARRRGGHEVRRGAWIIMLMIPMLIGRSPSPDVTTTGWRPSLSLAAGGPAPRAAHRDRSRGRRCSGLW